MKCSLCRLHFQCRDLFRKVSKLSPKRGYILLFTKYAVFHYQVPSLKSVQIIIFSWFFCNRLLMNCSLCCLHFQCRDLFRKVPKLSPKIGYIFLFPTTVCFSPLHYAGIVVRDSERPRKRETTTKKWAEADNSLFLAPSGRIWWFFGGVSTGHGLKLWLILFY